MLLGTPTGVNALPYIATLVIGIALRALWDRYFSERTKSDPELLEKISSGKPVTRYTEKRLHGAAKEILKELQSNQGSWTSLEPARLSEEKPISIVQRQPNKHPSSSRCPKADKFPFGLLYFQISSEEAIWKDLKTELNALFASAEGSKTLLNRCLFADNEGALAIWINAPDLRIRSSKILRDNIFTLQQRMAGHLPRHRVFLEVSIPEDLLQACIDQNPETHFIPPEPALDPPAQDALSGNLDLGRGGQYALQRKEAIEKVEAGEFIGELITDACFKIPQKVLEARMPPPLRNGVTFPKNSHGIALYGRPGMGKTQTIKTFLENKRERQKVSIIILSDQALNQAFVRLLNSCRTSSFESTVKFSQAVDGMAEAMTGSMPETYRSEFGDSDGASTAFRDASVATLTSPDLETVFIADDVHTTKELRDEVFLKNYHLRKNWKIITIGRASVARSSTLKFLDIKLNGFTLSQANSILDFWPGKKTSIECLERLKAGDGVNDQSISTYRLRLISQGFGGEETGSSQEEPLKNAIDSYFKQAKLKTVIGGLIGSNRLEQLRNQLKKKAPYDEILKWIDGKKADDPQKIVGVLSWYSRFHKQEKTINLEDVTKWTALTRKEAEQLFEMGRNLSIFSPGIDSSQIYWKDVFIADSCAALYLHSYFANISGCGEQLATISKMIEAFDDTGSLDFLILTLNWSDKLTALRALAAHAPAAGGTAAKLFAETLSPKLLAKSKQSSDLVFQFTEQAQLFTGQVLHLSQILAGYLEVSPDPVQALRELTKKYKQNSELVAGAISLHFEKPSLIFAMARHSDICPSNMLTISLLARGPAEIAIFLVESIGKVSNLLPEAIETGIEDWVKAVPDDQVFSTLQEMINIVIKGRHQDSQFTPLFEILFASWMKFGSEPYGYKIDITLAGARNLAQFNIELASILINGILQWQLASIQYPMTKWHFDLEKGVAIALNPAVPTKLRDCLIALSSNLYWRLPKSLELQSNKAVFINDPELVSDNLKGLDSFIVEGKVEIPQNKMRIWDGATMSAISSEMHKVTWRLCLQIPQSA
jgi:hypothetical protein